MENKEKSLNGKTISLNKIWTIVGVTASVVVVLLLCWKAINVFLFILAGAIMSIYFHGFAELIGRMTKMTAKWSLVASVLITIVFLFGISFLIGSRVANEAVQFSEQIPGLVGDAKKYMQQDETLKSVYQQVQSSEMLQKVTPMLSGFFNSTLGLFGDIYVVLFIGIFFTATPEIYKRGMVKLLPARARGEGRRIIDLIAGNLRSWLKGMLFSMFVVFVLTSIGLLSLGLDLWLILALIAGLLSFIPNFGPVIALIPAALVALSQSPTTALWVILLYGLVQLVESNFITPLVQQELIKTPPALIIISQVFVGIWLGAWGVILATPILVIMMVLTDELYIKKQDIKEHL
ncbi:AI-2E family transporter [Sphingobacterium sp. DN00404]|uniref:AI-2E family transporter n=1 Tax=Sphingobacterium micropteri TaxID=2763501 RepID=A0ABR7YJB8_9SPHI|nr:AI-2E family transporter [Sphingobacterium micropteri]MBD1431356.1 AI-2E family transporter [Sphingobacterium micropteri]